MAFRRFSKELQCTGKRWYSDKHEAKKAAKKSEQRFGRMDVYRCPHCDLWHIGHEPKRKWAQRPA
jgi:hypothetical protein